MSGFFSGFIFPDILYLHKKKFCFLNSPDFFRVLFDDNVGCSHLLLSCLEGSGPWTAVGDIFFPQQNGPAWIPSDGRAGTTQEKLELIYMIFLLYTPVRRIWKRLSVGKATEAEKYGEVAEALGGSNKARQRGRSPLSLWCMFFSLYSHHGYVRIAYCPC